MYPPQLVLPRSPKAGFKPTFFHFDAQTIPRQIEKFHTNNAEKP